MKDLPSILIYRSRSRGIFLQSTPEKCIPWFLQLLGDILSLYDNDANTPPLDKRFLFESAS
uniref:Uncharacterized protein n=1 Tax=Picea sitchensis TaxID=3332 RepID=A0A6B9XPP6_PICSI|nr:hypothetical protein Q903MT_gene3952 [Picea sitchensis]